MRGHFVYHLHKDWAVCLASVWQMIHSNCVDQPWLKRTPSSISQVFLPGFLSSNLYYKYLNDLIHSVRGDEFPGGSIALSIHGPGSSPDTDSVGAPDGSASQVRGSGFDSVVGKAANTVAAKAKQTVLAWEGLSCVCTRNLLLLLVLCIKVTFLLSC